VLVERVIDLRSYRAEDVCASAMSTFRRATGTPLLAQRDEIRQLPANVSNTGAAVSICISTDGHGLDVAGRSRVHERGDRRRACGRR
jgi:hypothetical protein